MYIGYLYSKRDSRNNKKNVKKLLFRTYNLVILYIITTVKLLQI